MAVEKKQNGKWWARVAVPTVERDSKGRIVRKNLTKTFDNETAANTWVKNRKQEIQYEGTQAAMSGRQLAEFREAKEITSGADLRDVAKFFALHNPTGVQKTLAEVIELYEESQKWERLADTTRVNHMVYLNAFKKTFADKRVVEISLEEVEDYLAQIPGKVTRHSHGSFLKGFFTWMSARRQRYIVINPLAALELDHISYDQPEFVVSGDVKKLFEAAVEIDPMFIPYMALGFFAGLRTAEIDRLEKKHFLLNDKQINVAGDVAKPKRQGKPLPRLLDGLPETLWEWLSAAQFDGKVDKVNRMKRYRNIYQKAEVERPNSAARHTFATYAYALTQDAGRVRKWTGHRGNDSVFLTHYAGLVEQKAGKSYFKEIMPPAKVITVEPKKKQRVSDDEIKMALKENSGIKTHAAKALDISEAAIRKRLKKITNYE